MTRIGFVKPEWPRGGGFERHVAALSARLTARGHDCVILPVSIEPVGEELFGHRVEPVFSEWHPEFFHQMAMLERSRHIDTTGVDVAIATQPPTWHATGAPLLPLFFHHARAFYDLAEQYPAAGFVDSAVHAQATKVIRSLDTARFADLPVFLAGSQTIAERLRRFSGVGDERIEPYRHPLVTEPTAAPQLGDPRLVTCVSRQEWPKRTELVVAAMHLVERGHLHLVGGGSRLDFVRSLDAELASEPGRAASIGTAEWNSLGIYESGWQPSDGPPSGRITFHTDADDRARDLLYGAAGVVVAPALGEDYGLTALEAFQAETPLVVCRDGGGLCEFVEHEVSGLVAEPTPTGIASAIQRLQEDPELRRTVVEGGRQRLAANTWTAAVDAFEAAVERCLDHS